MFVGRSTTAVWREINTQADAHTQTDRRVSTWQQQCAFKTLAFKSCGKVSGSHRKLPLVQSRTRRLATPRRLNALSRGCSGSDATPRTHACTHRPPPPAQTRCLRTLSSSLSLSLSHPPATSCPVGAHTEGHVRNKAKRGAPPRQRGG